MRRRFSQGLSLIVTLFFIVALSLTPAGPAYGERVVARYVPDELLVQPSEGVSKKEVHNLVKDYGASHEEEIEPIKVHRIKVPPQALAHLKAALENNPKFRFVERNYLAEEAITPSDPLYGSQWHLPKISAPQGWDLNMGSEAIPIAILDSGADPTHPDLAGKLLPGYNFLNGSTDTNDVRGHGTKVAGAAAAVADNQIGVAGVAWRNTIIPVVVLDANGSASYYNIAKGITYAADKGVRVISISIAGSSASSTLQNAVDYAWRKGGVIFAAAANYSTSTPYYPAACNNVVAVSATDSSDQFAYFSNFGNWVDIAAPGSSIFTTVVGGGYGSVSGTSFSSPIAAGLGALVLSANPALTNAQVVDIITKNADDLGATGFDPQFGWGRINVYESLVAALHTTSEPAPAPDPAPDPVPVEPPPAPAPSADTVAPVVAITAPVDGAYVSKAVKIAVSASDNVGVGRIEVYCDGSLLATASSVTSLTATWNTRKASPGEHVITAKAYDRANNLSVTFIKCLVVR